jgi:iron complex transport system substrate-binding protein
MIRTRHCHVAGLVPILLVLCFVGIPVDASQIELTDALGRKITFPSPARKVVALNSDAVEAVRILNAQDCIVGVFSQIETDPEFWGDLVNRPKVGSWREPNSEVISELEPDIVLAYAKTPSPEWEAQMASQGVRVLRLELYRIESIEREMRELGRVLGRTEEAERFCSWHGRWMSRIREKVDSIARRPWVYAESYGDYAAAGPTSGGHEMCVLAGGRNIAEDMAIPIPRVTPEWVVTRNPEVIIKAGSFASSYGAGDSGVALNHRRDAIMRRPAWNLIQAVTSGRVHVLDSSIWVGPRAVIGLAYLVQWLHPNLIADLDPEAMHKEYFETFQRLPYKGVFVSSPVTGAAGKQQ